MRSPPVSAKKRQSFRTRPLPDASFFLHDITFLRIFQNFYSFSCIFLLCVIHRTAFHMLPLQYTHASQYIHQHHCIQQSECHRVSRCHPSTPIRLPPDCKPVASIRPFLFSLSPPPLPRASLLETGSQETARPLCLHNQATARLRKKPSPPPPLP